MRSLLVAVLLCPALASASPPPTALESLDQLQHTYETRFPAAAAYWGVAGALAVTGGLTLGLSPIRSPTPNGQLALVSGIATIVSGVSSGFSAWPLTFAPSIFARRIAAHGGRASLREEDAWDILVAQAAWARRWRISVLVVTTVLLAANASVLTWYAVTHDYQRVSTAVVAGLYGLGVIVVPFYDLAPWDEEVAAQRVRPATPISVLPAILPTRDGVAFALNVSGVWP